MSTKKGHPRGRRGKSDAMAFLENLSGGPLTLAKLLRSIREGEALTKAELADTLGISKQHLPHIENGRKVVSPERAASWAARLGYAESLFVRLALQDALRRVGLRYTVTVRAELADLLAYPFKREMVAEKTGKAGELPKDFSSALLDAARSKINCQIYSGRIAGYGKVWLE